MPHKAVFLDRDNTLIDDPGYLSDPRAVRLLPGVEHALKRLAEAGYSLVVVTNQSGIARGLLTEQALGAIHAEMERQLALHGARVDAVYYCPYLPDAPVEAYARDSEDRKPRPGMLLRAGRDLDLDLEASWMVGDSARDIEAGQRAGCRTIRIRHGDQPAHGEQAATDDDTQADFTVRNLAEAAQLILRQAPSAPDAMPPAPAAPPSGTSAPPAVTLSGRAAAPGGMASPVRPPGAPMTDGEVLRELLQLARRLARQRDHREFSVSKLIAGVCQGLALLLLALGAVKLVGLGPGLSDSDAYWKGLACLVAAGVVQLVALTFFIMNRQD